MKKKTILLGILFVIVCPLFAQGASEIMTGIGQGASIGAGAAGGIGAGIGTLVAGPLGTLIGGAIGAGAGALIGGVAGIFTGSKQAEINTEKRQLENTSAYQTALGNLNTLEAQKLTQQTQIAQGEADLSSFDQALGRWQTQLDIQQQQSQTSGESQFNALYQNWQGTELINAAKGQTGGSAALIAEQSKQQVVNLVGSDLTLDLTGGTFGQSMDELQMDVLAGRSQLIGQRKITEDALGIRQDALTALIPEIGTAQEILATSKTKAGL